MSYVVPPPVDTSGFVENPLTAELDANSNDISNAGTVSATTGDMANVTISSQLEHSDAEGLIGFYGATPISQPALLTFNVVPSMPATYDAVELDAALQQLASDLNEVNNLIINLGLEAAE